MDRPDAQSGYQIHIIYAVPEDGTDRAMDTDGSIARSVHAFSTWFAAQAGGRRIRVDELFGGAIDVTFVRLSATDSAIAAKGAYVRTVLETQLRELGFAQPNKLYAVYYDGSSTYACGGGAYPPSLAGHVAAMYLHGVSAGSDCAQQLVGASANQPGYIDIAMLHEIVHTLGFVATCAPDINVLRDGHVGNDPADLMYRGDKPWQPLHMDPSHSNYFDHHISNCRDLAHSAFLDPLPPGAELPLRW